MTRAKILASALHATTKAIASIASTRWVLKVCMCSEVTDATTERQTERKRERKKERKKETNTQTHTHSHSHTRTLSHTSMEIISKT